MMPKRTNDFQQLVWMVQKALAPVGARVTESACIDEDLREIDVLIESNVGPYLMKIAVEAKDEKKPLDLIDIDAILGKYDSKIGVHVNHVVIVSHRGFTKRAIKKAQRGKIDLLTLQEAKQANWKDEILRVEEGTYKTKPCVDWVELIPPIPNKNDKDPLEDGRFFCKCHVRDVGSPLQWVNWVFTKLLADESFNKRIEEFLKQHNGRFVFPLSFKMSDNDFHFEGDVFTVETVTLMVRVEGGKSQMKWTSYDVADQKLDFADVSMGDLRIRLLVKNNEKGRPENVVARVTGEAERRVPSVKLDPKAFESLIGSFTFRHDSSGDAPVNMPSLKPTFKGRPPITPPRSPKKRKIEPKLESITKKVEAGRNELCTCGSGKKYKYCCDKKGS